MTAHNLVRESFKVQARYCRELGSPFNGQLCALLADHLDPTTGVGRRVLGWLGDAEGDSRTQVQRLLSDALALRLVGALHALAMRGAYPELTALYPPSPLPPPESVVPVMDRVLRAEEAEILSWLTRPPQTNEVGRASALMSGLLVIASETKLPLALYEIGSSAGLNLVLDRYAFDLGGLKAGTPTSPVRLAPKWIGAPPAAADLKIVRRRGVDLTPFNVTRPADRERMLAYIWPDQAERLARTRAAIAVAAADPPPLDTADAADWVESQISIAPEPDCTRVLMHSVMFQYVPKAGQERIKAHMAQAGAHATAAAPLAWVRMEMMTDDAFGPFGGLQLTMWPGGKERVLAHVTAHGADIKWL